MSENSEAAAPENQGAPASKRKPTRNRIGQLVAVIVVIVGIWFWIQHSRFSQTHITTDDAQLTVSMVQIAPQVSGFVSEVLVKENQSVKAGDVLVVLNDALYRSAVEEAEANLKAAIAQIRGSGSSIALAKETGAAQIAMAQGAIVQAASGVATSRLNIAKAQAEIAASEANRLSAIANIRSAQATLDESISAKDRLSDQVKSVEAAVETARTAVTVAEAQVLYAEAIRDKNSKDLIRFRDLAAQGAVSRQSLDAAEAAFASSLAQWESSRRSVAESQAALNQRMTDVVTAKRSVIVSDSAIARSRALLAAAQQAAVASAAMIRQSVAAKQVAVQNISTAEAQRTQANAGLKQAETTPHTIDLSRSNRDQTSARIEQLRAALVEAKTKLGYTKVRALIDGRVSRKSAELGQMVQPGSPLMYLVTNKDLWVRANYKETQMSGIRVGNLATVEIDAFPGKEFKGHVESISPATGATFALLPAENSTGNFTKIVQRISVKIVLEPGQNGIDLLRSGMSAVPTVEIH